jgi:hypothetical protein
MEDWVYASGWDPSQVNDRCKGLSKADAATGQALVFLVETSDAKSPSSDQLGCESNALAGGGLPVLLQPEGKGVSPAKAADARCNGHVSRNIRLALSAIDLVQPYACVSSARLVRTAAPSRRLVKDNAGVSGVDVSWYVGGGLKVDATWLSWHNSPVKSGESDAQYLFKTRSNYTNLLHVLKPPSVEINKEHPRLRGAASFGGARFLFENESSAIMTGPTVWSAKSDPKSAGNRE